MRVALSLGIDLDDRLGAEAFRHGHDVVSRADTADELAFDLERARPDAVLAVATPRHLTGRLVAECDRLGVRVIAVVDGAPQSRHAAGCGVLEHVEADVAWPELEQRLGTPGRAPEASGAPVTPGGVIAVWGPAGAPGRTTVAIALAAELAARGRRVLLGDVDTHAASVAPALQLPDEAPGFAAACRLAGAGALDAAELARIAQHYDSPRGGFDVLTGIGRPSRWPELSAERVTTTIARCRTVADHVVLDTSASLERDEELTSDLDGPRRNAATIAALESADHVVAVASGDPVGLARFLRAHVDLLETVGTDRVTVVVNKVRVGAIGLSPQAQVAHTLERFGGVVAPVIVPHDLAGADAALLSGRAIADVAPRSPVVQAIGGLVEQRLLPPVASARRARRAWRRPALARG